MLKIKNLAYLIPVVLFLTIPFLANGGTNIGCQNNAPTGAPMCGGSCPNTGESCQDNNGESAGGLCQCLPTTCGSTYPQCDGPCPRTTVCTNSSGACYCYATTPGPDTTTPPDLGGLPDPANPPGTVTGQENTSHACSPTGNTIGPKMFEFRPFLKGFYLGCDPSCPPANGGCNFQHAVKFILYLVGNAYKVGIALAIAMIMWAGYKIIFAGARGEDYKEGGKIIKTAIIGFAITVLASFIVQLVLKIFY